MAWKKREDENERFPVKKSTKGDLSFLHLVCTNMPARILIVNPEHNNSHHHLSPSGVSPFGDKESNSHCF